MKKIVLIICNMFLVIVLCVSLFVIFNNKEEKDKIILKDYSYVNVEEIKTMELSTLSDDDNVISVRDVRISSGFLEGSIVINSDKSYKKLKTIVNLYDEEGNILDEISFEFEDVSPYEERDLFYAIQKDLSDTYYVDIKEG